MYLQDPPKLFFVCFFFGLATNTVLSQEFGYEGSEGPSHWGEIGFRQCVGKHQSPINIEEHNVEVVHMQAIDFENFDQVPDGGQMTNNGHTVVFTINNENNSKTPSISGGPLLGEYEFAQLHFHWGSHDREGSENTINNSSFPMELHIVFYQKAYGSYAASTEHPDGLAVLSFLYYNSEEDNENYNALVEALPFLELANSSKTLDTHLPSLDELTMHNRSVYFTYGGSLTTPPCSEVVTWIEFKTTIPMSHKQIEAFRHLKDERGHLMSHNFRPTQPLHGRRIRMTQIDSDKDIYYTNTQHLKQKNSGFHFKPFTFLMIGTLANMCRLFYAK